MSTPLRPCLDASAIDPAASQFMSSFHADVVAAVREAVAEHAIVVVGMSQNPHVKGVRQALTEASFTFKYMEYGSYLSHWRQRLAIKLWSGWPTYPQVFARGVLIGGEQLTRAAIADGSLKRRIEAAQALAH